MTHGNKKAAMIEPMLYISKTFNDARGWLKKLEPEEALEALDAPHLFDDFYISQSNCNVFRGLHYQKEPYEQWKRMRVISGSIRAFALNTNPKSKRFKRLYTFHLNGELNETLLCPPMHASGFLSLENESTVLMLASGKYNLKAEHVISPKSVKGITLPEDCIISEKDLNGEWLERQN